MKVANQTRIGDCSGTAKNTELRTRSVEMSHCEVEPELRVLRENSVSQSCLSSMRFRRESSLSSKASSLSQDSEVRSRSVQVSLSEVESEVRVRSDSPVSQTCYSQVRTRYLEGIPLKSDV